MYGKIFEQTFTGSMFGKSPLTFAVWAYVIANTKPDHRVELNQMREPQSLGRKWTSESVNQWN
jgi:hypothetical protein